MSYDVMRCCPTKRACTASSSIGQTSAASHTRDSDRESTRSVDQLVLQRVVGQVAVGGQVHLFHQARAVGADGLHTQGQRLGDVAGGLALGELQEDLELALGQLLVRRASSLGSSCCASSSATAGEM